MKELIRCPWATGTSTQYTDYHDLEWGVPVYDDRLIFEFLVLESAQAGLSWSTILKRREGYRIAFDGFDPVKVARYDQTKKEQLLQDVGIIRNRLKIDSAVNNAQRFLKIQEEFGTFSHYIWRFVDGHPIVHEIRTSADYLVTSPESDILSKDLKQRGFSFLGSTIVYAHMQATGLVNDHTVNCFRRQEITQAYNHAFVGVRWI
ncbi:DNA-3-methyladenine glycosylase I [bacterium]|nr:DNA-3-methyladenine glycosylase I [bacterium]